MVMNVSTSLKQARCSGGCHLQREGADQPSRNANLVTNPHLLLSLCLKMNWTGGSLQRTKNASKGVLQKQKAYFARTRTHLKNGSQSSAIPFRPSYVPQDDNFNLTRYLYPENLTETRCDSPDHVAGGTHVYSARDSATRDLQTSRADPNEPAVQRLRKHDLVGKLLGKHVILLSCGDTYPYAGSQKGKRKRDNADTEIDLMEAKRKQLLKKRDWIGVAPSQPLLPSFLASKESARFGKRRRVRESNVIGLRHRDNANAAARSSRLVDYQYAGDIVKLRNADHLNDIRIRIGTDALTTVASTIPNDNDQSFASSDSMLFDQQSHDTERLDAIGSAKRIASFADVVEHPRPWERNHVSPDSQWTDEQLQHNRSATAGNSGKLMGPHRLRKQRVKARGDQGLRVKEKVAREQPYPQPQITQYAEGVRQPFRLVFGSSNSSESNQPQDFETGGTDYACDAAHAGETEKTHMHEPSDEPGFRVESEAAATSAIVDVHEALWKSVLDLAEQSSSQTRASKKSGTSTVHAHPKARSHEVGHHSWSQHATQGDQTRIGSSLVSASLPSLKQEVQLDTNVQGRAKDTKRRQLRTSTILDQEEQLWQNFVFGSGEELCSGVGYGRGSGNIQCWKPSSGVPLSVAVSSVSSTPFRATHVPHTTDSVHDTAMFAPPSRPRTIPPSAATAGVVDKVGDGEGERRALARQSVTHSSLLNNASGDTNFSCSGMSGRTETSRGGLEQTDHSRDSLLEHQAGSSPRRILNGDSDPDDWGIDLVDPDRM